MAEIPMPPHEAEAREDRGRAKRVPGGSRGFVIRVNPDAAEQYFFKQLAIQYEHYEESVEESRIKDFPNRVARIIHDIMKPYVSSLLGQIMDPRFSSSQFHDRIVQFVDMMLVAQMKEIDQLILKMKEKQLRGENVAEEIERILENFDTIFFASREIMNRMYTLLQINAPLTERPPLANIKAGGLQILE